jgi:hypothetical protein
VFISLFPVQIKLADMADLEQEEFVWQMGNSCLQLYSTKGSSGESNNLHSCQVIRHLQGGLCEGYDFEQLQINLIIPLWPNI